MSDEWKSGNEPPALPMWGRAPDRTPSFEKTTQRDTFVSPLRELPAPVRRIEILPPEPVELQAPGTQTTHITLTTTHWDRARGFSLATVPLAAAVGIGALLISIFFFGLELWSLAAVTVLFLGFLATWLVAWVVYQFTSPDGVNLFSAWGHYSLLRHEQRARLRRMERNE